MAIFVMPKHKRYPDIQVKRTHVDNLQFHKWPKNPKLAEIWRKQVAKSRCDEFHPPPGAQGTFICSNHFPLGKRTPKNLETDYPSVFMTISEYHHASTPKKRKMNRMQEQSIPLRFEQFTREFEVKFYTGLPSTECFKCVFDFLLPKVQNMQYWHGAKQTEKETSKVPSTPFELFAGSSKKKWPTTKTVLRARAFVNFNETAPGTAHRGFGFQVSGVIYHSKQHCYNLDQTNVQRTCSPRYMA